MAEAVKQYREMDDTGITAWDFIRSIIDEYDLKRFLPHVEIRGRGVMFGLADFESHRTDDAILQLVVRDMMVAMVFTRRDDLNYTEITTVFVKETMDYLNEHFELKPRELLVREMENEECSQEN